MKKALIIGINYTDIDIKDVKLKGCINDANNIKDFIINKLDYKDKDIVMMTDTQTKSINILPTRENILEQMKILFSYKDAELFFSYSGHGTQKYSIDEPDGKDEIIVPVDLIPITDNQIRDLLNNMSKSSNLYVIMDACNSGTNFDLPYKYANKIVTKTGESIGDLPYVVKLSSSIDKELSKEAEINGIKQGLFTYYFVQEYNPNYTYKEFVDKLDIEINKFLSEKQTPLSTSSREDSFDDKLFSKIIEKDDNKDDNISLILGLTLGLGLPLLIIIVYYINFKMKK